MTAIDFNEMYQMYARKLTSIAYSVTKDWFIAEDVVQEAFVKAYKKVGTIEDVGKIGAWLSSITVRTAIDFLRMEKRRKCVCVDFTLTDHSQLSICTEGRTETEVEVRIFKEEIAESMHVLSNEYQQVLLLKMEYGLKENEIASLLQLKPSTVKTRLYRARKKLKNAIAEKYPA